MKNFKKVLALVLVLATLMGLATVAGAAYKDADEISADYTEATKVLELIETMEGYPDGSFGPKKTITREEAAKLIAIFDNKDADIETYYTSINPFADEKGRWGESYVGYGFRAGIIAGMNATTFAPTANVTGTQFLKMVLVTLGYDAEAEGFVGASWAVNVLALAKRIGLVDDLADGWKAENDLTREEAAQIMLNALNTETVEYGSQFKAPAQPVWESNKSGDWTGFWMNGKFYVTVAGAITTGDKLYESFKLKPSTVFDAFERPQTKWTKGNDSVKVLWNADATFTTKFNPCDLLVALGIEETNTDDKIVIDNYYVNGEEVYANLALDFHHTVSKCEAKNTDVTFGAQGTLTQAFEMSEEADGTKHYRVCSIDTWLAKVTKVSTYTTSRDGHKKGSEAVDLTVYLNDSAETTFNGIATSNYADYVGETHCANTFDKGEWTTATFDEPTGLAKNDYVLINFSRKLDSNNKHMGVQDVEVVEAKEGRLNGFKLNKVADPSETRIDGEYITDSQHFHLGYADSKNEDMYGTHAFFYDHYGNVIGMKDGADTSAYSVFDKVYIEHVDGVAVLYADVVGLDGNVTKKVVIENLELYGLNGYVWTENDVLEWALQFLSNGENFKDFYNFCQNGGSSFYDNLFKVSTNSKGEYDFKETGDNYGMNGITIVAGKPFVEVGSTTIKTSTDTQYLIRTGDVGDGQYKAYTGYRDVKSLKAADWEVVLDDDGVAEVVYAYGNVVFTDGKVVAYVPGTATTWNEETADDAADYFMLEVYVDGVVNYLKIDQYDAKYFDTNEGGFYQFQYVDIDEVTTAKVVKDWDGKLKTAYTVVDFYDDYALEVSGLEKMALADDCAVYSIRDNGEVVKEDVAYADAILEAGRTVYLNWSDDNDFDVNMITALYVVEDADAPWFD